MSVTDLASATAVQNSLRRVRALRSQIASELAGAAVNIGDDIDMADDLENLRSWLDDGTATLQDAIKGADHMVCAAGDDQYERGMTLAEVAA